MAALLFPTPVALRLALTSGLVPGEVARSPATAATDSHGHIWIELTELLPRHSLAALHRLGVQVVGRAGVPTDPIRSWAELIPLVRAPQIVPAGTVLFVVPERRLASFVARLRRSNRAPLAIALPEQGTKPVGWVVASSVTIGLLTEIAETDTSIEAFAEQAPHIWVRCDWQHPLPEHLVAPKGLLLVLRPPRAIEAIPGRVPVPSEEEYALDAALRSRVPSPTQAVRIPIRFQLAPRRDRQRDSLWVLNEPQTQAFWSFCAAADERLIRRLEAAVLTNGAETRLVVRMTGNRHPVVFPFDAPGYAPDPRLPGLYLPARAALRPTLRIVEVVRLFQLASDRIVWIEAPSNALIHHAVPLHLFRPVLGFLEYAATPLHPLSILPRGEPFPLAPWPGVQSDASDDLAARPLDRLPQAPGIEQFEEEELPLQTGLGWLRRSLGRLTARLRRQPERTEPAPAHPDPPDPEPGVAGRRVERKLATPDALLHGRDWSARRRELETQLFQELPTLHPERRGTRWSDLASIYTTTGNAADAAICWMNAVWDTPPPVGVRLEQWFAAECRSAKFTDQSGGLERWLNEPNRPGVARVIAAYTAWAGFSATPPAGFIAALRRILAYLDQHFDDLPIRAAWLARLAATRLCDGDVLGLARWRDRVLARLGDRGPALDLDEPSFLRFHGTASADRFQTAREWLIRIHDPVVGWIQRHGGSGRLRSSGLDAETEATTAYAQFMLAWGLGCLGERTLSMQWAARARKKLARASGTGVDPAGHGILSEMFFQRVRDAQEGRPPKLGLAPELASRHDALTFLTRYAVDRLREHSRILEPLERVRAYRGTQLKAFWGNDRLAERLLLLAERPDLARAGGEADSLLQLCAENPSTATVPRVVLTLLEIGPWLEPTLFLRVIDLLPTALEWTEAWLSSGRGGGAERSSQLLGYQTRMIEAACSTATTFPLTFGAAAIGQLIRRLVEAGEEYRRPLLFVAGSVFRCLRRLRLASEANALIQLIDLERLGASSSNELPPEGRVGLAIGSFITNNDDFGNRLLNEAREALFLAEGTDLRQRTQLAIAYAEALGFAPPRIAHGRLEELFQRPRFLVEAKGSTNRFFTLKPLQLIDTIVRSVVTDDFTLGPAVRDWLDDDEFLIRGRIHRDMTQLLHEQGMG